MDFVKPSTRAASLLGGLALIFASAAHAVAQLELDLKNAVEMDSACRLPTAGTPANVVKDHCNARDNLYQRLKEEGWCPIRDNSQRDFIRCDSEELKPAPPPAPIVVDQRPGKRVRILAYMEEPGSQRLHVFRTGETVPASAIRQILYGEPCALPLTDTKGMYAYEQHMYGGRVPANGCWYRTLDDVYSYVLANGMTATGGNDYKTLPRALLHDDGTATITEFDYHNTMLVGVP
jgi:hypothetical protein